MSVESLQNASIEGRLFLRKGHGPLSSGTAVRLVGEDTTKLLVTGHGKTVAVPQEDLVIRRRATR